MKALESVFTTQGEQTSSAETKYISLLWCISQDGSHNADQNKLLQHINLALEEEQIVNKILPNKEHV